MLTRNVLYYGREQSLPEQVPLRAGPLSLVFEQGMLRYLRLGESEVLRAVYAAVRDANWGTLANRISNLSIKRGEASFQIRYDVENREGGIDFRWSGSITGDENGTIALRMSGKAFSTFLKSRIGFCVLHPVAECAGRPCTVEKIDGRRQSGAFPLHISPHQPFFDIAAIAHEVAPGLTAEVRFSGDVFEMEDQRNWTDASYKTYSTPLSLPYPAEIKAGTEVEQSVTLTLRGAASEKTVPAAGAAVSLAFSDSGARPLPGIGLCVASHGAPLGDAEVARLKALNLSHLRADLPSSAPDAFERAFREAAALGLPLEAAVFLTGAAEDELKRLASRLAQLKPRIARWLVFHENEKSTRAKWVALAREQLGAYDSGAQFVSGTNAYFTELNRERPETSLLDGACFSVNPQVHAFDNDTLVENLAAQAAVVKSARQFLRSVPVVVSPVTLKPRFNPVATGEDAPDPEELPAPVDPRQMSLLGAGWTGGSLKYLAEAGAASVTYYETSGWRGVMETATGSPLPQRFHSIPGGVFPLYHVLADAGEFRGGEVLPSYSSYPLRADGLVLRRGGRMRILIANFRPEVQAVRLSAAQLGRQVRLKMLDETNAERAMTAPEQFRAEPGQAIEITGQRLELSLRPYAVARIDTVPKESQ